jgi:hypothetical protein
VIARRLLAAIAVAVVAFAVSDDEHGPGPAAVVNVTPKAPELVDFRVGAFRGVRLGESRARVLAALGPPSIHAPSDAELPSGPADAISLDYSDMTVYTREDRVVWIVVTSPNAQTRFGVGIGDSLAVARLGQPPPGVPICLERLRPGVNIELIGDPIVAIVVHGTRPGLG